MGQKKGLFKYHTKEVRNWDREAHQKKVYDLKNILFLKNQNKLMLIIKI